MPNKKFSKSASARKAAEQSTGKPVAIVVIGVVIALGLAVFLSQRGADETAATSTETFDAVVTEATHIRGAESASVTLVEFGDFQCPTCGAFHPILRELLSRSPDDLKLEFHHMPLVSIHPNAMSSSLAAEAAGIQGKFWEMNDLLFENQQAWSPLANPDQAYISYAERLALDVGQFTRDMRSPQVQERVLADATLSRELGLPGTPSFFLNDAPIPIPPSYSEFERIIYDAIQNNQ